MISCITGIPNPRWVTELIRAVVLPTRTVSERGFLLLRFLPLNRRGADLKPEITKSHPAHESCQDSDEEEG
jgi:hypothetical protein